MRSLLTATRRELQPPSGSARGDYRPALDGVRAVAVLAVISFHISSGNKPSGGFLGVDVFFVLSGYLITTLLLRELAASGSIRLGRFWARRARRLLPALLVLVTACATIAAFDAPIVSLGARRSDMISALFYYANWHFIATSQSYFAAQTAGTSPLLHTWSLAIEEQFYVLWPLLVMIVMYLARGRRLTLLIAIAALTAISVVRMTSLYDSVDPTRSYFGTDTRAQALLVGAALATLLSARPSLMVGARASAIARWSGPVVAMAVVAAFLALHEQSPFYYRGGAALFALVAAAGLWIVETAPGAFPGALLCLAPIRWIGKVSYGLYLWHWPIILWLAPRWTHSFRVLQLLELIATFAAASASYYVVERPIRAGAVPWLRLSSARLAIVLGFGVAVVAGFAVKSTTPGSAIAREVADTSESACPADSPTAGSYYIAAGAAAAAWCSRIAPATAASSVVATVGDSTSRALDPGMRKIAAARGWRYIQAGLDGCSVLRLVVPRTADAVAARQARSCAKVVPRLLDQVAATYQPDVWIVSDLTGHDASDPAGITQRRIDLIEESIHATLRRLTRNGAHVVVIAPLPTGQPIECATRKPTPTSCARGVFTMRYPQIMFMGLLERRAIADFPGKIAYVRLDDILCPRGRCPAVIGGQVARFDGTHYTSAFSRKMVPIVIARAERAGVHFTRR